MDVLVITSQYYHSRFSFVVEYNEDTFQQQAIGCIEELEKYKRKSDDTREIHLGDLDDKYYHKGRRRNNVNDAGDIYFDVCVSVNMAVYEVTQYSEHSKIESVGFKKKTVLENISNHHSYDRIKEIVCKYFKLL